MELNITTHPKTINPDHIAFPNLRYNIYNAIPIVTNDDDTNYDNNIYIQKHPNKYQIILRYPL